MNEKKIILSDKQIELIESELKGEFAPYSATPEEQKLFGQVMDDANELVKELNAFDEINGNLLQWYYNKYKEQQAQ